MLYRSFGCLLLATGLLISAGCAESTAADSTGNADTTDSGDDATSDEQSGDDAGDESSDTGSDDTSTDEPTPEPGDDGTTGGIDCSENEDTCEAPFECMEDTCRLPISGISEADVDFEFTQPEELDAIFSLFKAFTSGVKFFAMDVDVDAPIFNRYGARYGSADIISDNPLEITWQTPEELESIFFTPHSPTDGLDDGRSWVTEPFTYKLRTEAQIQFGSFQNDASIALDILDAIVVYRMVETGVPSLATVNGVLTREESENRELGTHEELEGIMANFVCLEVPEYVPDPTDGEVKWHLSDVLDCNNAELDFDYDADGTLDAYTIELQVEMATTAIVTQ